MKKGNIKTVSARISDFGHCYEIYCPECQNWEQVSIQAPTQPYMGVKFTYYNYTFEDGVKLILVKCNECGAFFYIDYSEANIQITKMINEQNNRYKTPVPDFWMVQYLSTLEDNTSECKTRHFSTEDSAKDFFLQSKSEMIDDARKSDDYKVHIDTKDELYIKYEDRCSTISIESVFLSDTENELKRSFFKS